MRRPSSRKPTSLSPVAKAPRKVLRGLVRAQGEVAGAVSKAADTVKKAADDVRKEVKDARPGNAKKGSADKE